MGQYTIFTYWDEYYYDAVTDPFKSGPRKDPPAHFTHSSRTALSSWAQTKGSFLQFKQSWFTVLR